MTDRELLELAAKAARYKLDWDSKLETYWWDIKVKHLGIWNPLNNDGDALRLAVKLGIIRSRNNMLLNKLINEERRHHLQEEATRRAIVRAAAEIGKERQ